jgi:hypothetical protein
VAVRHLPGSPFIMGTHPDHHPVAIVTLGADWEQDVERLPIANELIAQGAQRLPTRITVGDSAFTARLDTCVRGLCGPTS